MKRVNKRSEPAIPPTAPPINDRLTSGSDAVVRDATVNIVVSLSCHCPGVSIGILELENTSELSVVGDRVEKM